MCREKGTPPSVCRLGEGGPSCVGCCLYAFAGREATLAAIRRNTAEFARRAPGDEAALVHFRDREAPADVVCCNCIEEAPGVLGCPLHPARHGFRDLRRGHCMADFLCRTATLYRNEWSPKKRARFVSFAESRRFDSYEYSRLVVSDELLETFLAQDHGAEDSPSRGGPS